MVANVCVAHANTHTHSFLWFLANSTEAKQQKSKWIKEKIDPVEILLHLGYDFITICALVLSSWCIGHFLFVLLLLMQLGRTMRFFLLLLFFESNARRSKKISGNREVLSMDEYTIKSDRNSLCFFFLLLLASPVIWCCWLYAKCVHMCVLSSFDIFFFSLRQSPFAAIFLLLLLLLHSTASKQCN